MISLYNFSRTPWAFLKLHLWLVQVSFLVFLHLHVVYPLIMWRLRYKRYNAIPMGSIHIQSPWTSFVKTFKSRGPFKFYIGSPVYCIQIATHVMITWILLYSFIFFILKGYAQPLPTSLNLSSSPTCHWHSNGDEVWVFLNLFWLCEFSFCFIYIFLEDVVFQLVEYGLLIFV